MPTSLKLYLYKIELDLSGYRSICLIMRQLAGLGVETVFELLGSLDFEWGATTARLPLESELVRHRD